MDPPGVGGYMELTPEEMEYLGKEEEHIIFSKELEELEQDRVQEEQVEAPILQEVRMPEGRGRTGS